MDSEFERLEAADRLMMSDHGLYGVLSGLAVSENAPTALEVVVTAGTAYDQIGQRIRNPGTQVVDLDVDYLGASTTVVTVGNSKWLSLYVEFDRDLTVPQTDGNGVLVYTSRAEFLSFKVVQGAEAISPTKPALLTDAVLLADILLEQGDTAIVDADINVDRRMVLFRITGSPDASPTSIVATTIKDALTQLVSAVNTSFTYDGSGFFANGVTSLAPGQLGDVLDAFVAALAATTTPSGDDLLGVREDDTASPTLPALPADTLRTRLTTLRGAAVLLYAGSGAWADGTTIPATSVAGALSTIVMSLAATTGLGGIAKIGAGAVAQSPTSLVAGTLSSQVIALLTAVNARARIASAETITAKYTFDLAAPGTGLETASDTTADFNGPVTVDDITATSTNQYKLASRSITRAQSAVLYNGTANINGYGSVPVAPGDTATETLDRIPNGATLNTVTIYHDRIDTGVLPTTKVVATIQRRNITTGVDSTIGAATEDPSVLATYEAHHGFAIGSLSEVIDRGQYVYWVELTGESGANTSTTIWSGCLATFTTTAQDDGAS